MSLIENIMQPHAKEEAKVYLSKKEIPQLMESLTAGLLHHRPVDPVEFVQNCLALVRDQPDKKVKWDTFIEIDPSSRPQSAYGQSRSTGEFSHDHS